MIFTPTPLPLVLASALFVALASAPLEVGPRTDTSVVTHPVNFGETLSTLAQLTSTDEGQLAQMNTLARGDDLQEGQLLRMPQHPSHSLQLHRVIPHETVLTIAAQHATSPYILRTVNHLSCADCLVTGQMLRIPTTVQASASALPYPLMNIHLSSNTPRQGDVMIVRVQTDNATRVEGQLGPQRIRFAPDEGRGSGRFIGLAGLDAMMQPGSYRLTITATTGTGAQSSASGKVTLRPGQYLLEPVAIATKLMPLLDPDLNADEAWEIKRIYSGYSTQQWWSGPFNRPVVGKLVSGYGNRRVYNDVNLGTYHTGYDIAAPIGTPVRAGAPGRVVAVRPFAIRGLIVVIDHGRGVFTGYFHLSRTDVKEGQMVDQGDVIGVVGNSGRSQGPHVHFDLAVGGVTVDPGYWTEVALP
ncbi:MAG: LysM peptidoglycan-binding domain-containing M23 family metallopeptidase [Chloroflexi bacterium]|nr:LysM peptidoglycan-binding domain-containing M23 family metallopeptidase [Chloroflexota bacterium]